MSAGTRRALIKVASSKIANATPNPSNLIAVTPLVTNAAKTMAKMNAAAVMILADFWSPIATDSVLVLPASCSSLIRERRNTS